eukprot:14902441-Alexandrium_andersonii.AAC.1
MGLRTPAEIIRFLLRRCAAPMLSSPGPPAGDSAVVLGAQLSAPALAILAVAWQTQLCYAV